MRSSKNDSENWSGQNRTSQNACYGHAGNQTEGTCLLLSYNNQTTTMHYILYIYAPVHFMRSCLFQPTQQVANLLKNIVELHQL